MSRDSRISILAFFMANVADSVNNTTLSHLCFDGLRVFANGNRFIMSVYRR